MKIKHLKKALLFIIGLIIIILIYHLMLQNIQITENDGKALINMSISNLKNQPYTEKIPIGLSKRTPVFLSLYQNNKRIACVGYTKPLFPLSKSIHYLSKGIKVEPKEKYEIVITIFGEYEKVQGEDQIKQGKGIMVRREGLEGVVLPFTFQEQNLTDQEALNLAASKAGFDDFSWGDFEVFTFESRIFRSTKFEITS